MDKNDFTIPVFLDSYKKEVDLSRFTYFTIEFDTPSAFWSLNLNGNRIPIYLIDLSAIIFSPINTIGLFNNHYQIEEIFNSIEKHNQQKGADEAFISIEEIWFPNFLFKNQSLNRGDVFRVEKRLFDEAFKFQNQKINIEEFLIESEKFIENFNFSEEETIVFNEWSKRELEIAKEFHRENRNKLKKIQDDNIDDLNNNNDFPHKR